MKFLRTFLLFLLVAVPFAAFAQSIDILWQGEGYVPPFYKGKTLWAKQTPITFVAIPHGLGNPANLNYKWTQNGTVLGSVSGVGRNSLSFTDSIFSKPYEIRVEIVSPSEEVLAESETVVAAQDPKLLVYEDNPLYGYMFHSEIGQTFKLAKGEATLAAFPIFASPPARESAEFSYRWLANGKDAWSGSSVTYRAPESGGGLARVSLTFSNSAIIARPLEREFLIQFGGND